MWRRAHLQSRRSAILRTGSCAIAIATHSSPAIRRRTTATDIGCSGSVDLSFRTGSKRAATVSLRRCRWWGNTWLQAQRDNSSAAFARARALNRWRRRHNLRAIRSQAGCTASRTRRTCARRRARGCIQRRRGRNDRFAAATQSPERALRVDRQLRRWRDHIRTSDIDIA